jgi:hypothetical protein
MDPSRLRGDGKDIHIDGCESTVGHGAADSASEGESGVEVEASGRRSGLRGHGSLCGIDLGLSGGRHDR